MKPRAILSLILSVILIFGGIIPATAQQVGAVNGLDDALIVHNAFDGTTYGAGLKDTAGTSLETINTYSGGTVNKFTGTGAITINPAPSVTTNAYGVHTVFGHKDNTSCGNDIKNNTTGEFTFYTAFKVSGLETPGATSVWNDLFNLQNTTTGKITSYARVIMQQDATTTDALDGKANLCFIAPDGKAVGQKAITYGTNMDYVHLMISMRYDETATAWTYTGYISMDGVTYSVWFTKTFATYNIGTTATTVSADFFKDATRLSFGNVKAAGTATYMIDDFRIYNKALTVGELQYHLTGVEATAGAVCHGVQVSNFASTDSSYALRFVGSIDSLTAYKEVGFEITVGDDYKWDFAAEEVYSSLIASGDMGMVEEYTAAKLRGDGSYLYAISLTEIPLKESNVNATYTFTVKPYSIAFDSDERVYSQAYNFTFTAGVFQSAAKA